GGIISKGAEKDYKLSDTLHDGNILRIKRLSEFSELEIIHRCKLEYGIKVSDDGLVDPHGKAFTFNKHNYVIERFKQNADIYSKTESITRNNKHEITYQKNLISSIKVSSKLPWSSLSAGFN
ncbi:15827_t:CDS:1, partial [Racocetra persica]